MKKRGSTFQTNFWAVFAAALLTLSIMLVASDLTMAEASKRYRMFWSYFNHYRETD